MSQITAHQNHNSDNTDHAVPRASLLERFTSFGLYAVEKAESFTNLRLVIALAVNKHHTALQTAPRTGTIQCPAWPRQRCKPRHWPLPLHDLTTDMSNVRVAVLGLSIRLIEVKNVTDCLQGQLAVGDGGDDGHSKCREAYLEDSEGCEVHCRTWRFHPSKYSSAFGDEPVRCSSAPRPP